MAQPPLSQAIRRLEDSLGVQLFERTSRVVSPTEAGRFFAEKARRVLASLDLAVAAARRASALETDLRIGCVHDLPLERLLRFLAALKEHDSTVQPRVTHLPSVEQVRRLRRGELDLGVFHDARESGWRIASGKGWRDMDTRAARASRTDVSHQRRIEAISERQCAIYAQMVGVPVHDHGAAHC